MVPHQLATGISHLHFYMLLLGCFYLGTVSTSYDGSLSPSLLFFFVLFWQKPIRFIGSFALALMTSEGLKELCSGNLIKPQGLWWTLNSSSAVSADSLSQKGKKNKLGRVWVCWEHFRKSWEGQGRIGKQSWQGKRDFETGAFGHWAILQSLLAMASPSSMELTKSCLTWTCPPFSWNWV